MQEKEISHLREKLEKAGLLPLRRQAETADRILKEKLEHVLPGAMAETAADCWIVIARENNDDPIMRTLFTSDMPYARRIAAFVFIRDERSGDVRRFYAGPSSPGMSALYERPAADGDDGLSCVIRLVKEFKPRNISVGTSSQFGFCDGLSATLLEELKTALAERAEDFVSGEDLSVIWLESMTDLELRLMKTLTQVTADIIKLVFSSRFITPGVTTTTDLEWLMRDCISDLGFINWFGPDVDLQRQGDQRTRIFEAAVERGDLLHCDIGMAGKYARLSTDMQWLAYVFRHGETSPPNGFSELLKAGNRFQDIVCSFFKTGESGNAVFQKATAQAVSEGMTPMLYTHPLGTFGHGAGPAIGVYKDQSGSIKGRGERLLRAGTCFALELNVCSRIAEWDGQKTFAYLEESVCFDGEKVTYLSDCGRQTSLIELRGLAAPF
ncbi:MAG: hypothetical protein LBR87_01115 [Synergistaceae bacterium]|jgi:hypothetical protein|nr:hypothetical protein [Synergistaceae bacterium]